MVKKNSDEPDDKALERLRQFENERKPVPDTANEMKRKDKKNQDEPKEEEQDDSPDSATDKRKV